MTELAQYVKQLMDGRNWSVIEWLGRYQVAALGTAYLVGEPKVEGSFPLPKRPADAVYADYAGDDDDPSLGSIQYEIWQEGTELLIFHQVEDPVMSMDHMAWFRIPLNTARAYKAHRQLAGTDMDFGQIMRMMMIQMERENWDFAIDTLVRIKARFAPEKALEAQWICDCYWYGK